MNRLKEQFKKSASVNGSYSVGAIVLVLCVVVLVNMLAFRKECGRLMSVTIRSMRLQIPVRNY